MLSVRALWFPSNATDEMKWCERETGRGVDWRGAEKWRIEMEEGGRSVRGGEAVQTGKKRNNKTIVSYRDLKTD